MMLILPMMRLLNAAQNRQTKAVKILIIPLFMESEIASYILSITLAMKIISTEMIL